MVEGYSDYRGLETCLELGKSVDWAMTQHRLVGILEPVEGWTVFGRQCVCHLPVGRMGDGAIVTS